MRLWRQPWRLSFRRGARSVRGCPTACRGTLGGLTGPPTNKRQGVARKKGPCFGQETVARKKGPLSVGMAVARGRASPTDPREICRGKNMRAFFLGRLFPGGYVPAGVMRPLERQEGWIHFSWGFPDLREGWHSEACPGHRISRCAWRQKKFCPDLDTDRISCYNGF